MFTKFSTNTQKPTINTFTNREKAAGLENIVRNKHSLVQPYKRLEWDEKRMNLPV